MGLIGFLIPIVAAAAKTAVAVVTFAATAGGIGGFIARAALFAGASLLLRKKPSVSTPGSDARALTVMFRSPIASHRFIYGERRVSGVLYPIGTSASGNVNSFLHIIIVLAGHEVQEIGEVYFGDTHVPTTVDSTDADGIERLVPASGNKYEGKARIKKHLGSTTQTYDLDLEDEVTAWTTAHHGKGRAYLYVRLEHDNDVYKGGVPNISCWVKGKKVLDTRTAATGYTNNPALCIHDYLLDEVHGLHMEGEGAIDEATSNTSATSCEETVAVSNASTTFTANTSTEILTLAAAIDNLQTGDTFQVTTTGTLPTGLVAATNYNAIRVVDGEGLQWQAASNYSAAMAGTAINITSTGSGTHTFVRTAEARYTLNAVFLSSQRPSEILGAALSSMMGKAPYIGGKWYLKAGVYTSPTITLTDDDLRAPIEVNTKRPRQEQFNGVKGLFASPQENYQPTDFPPYFDQTGYAIANSNWDDTTDLIHHVGHPFDADDRVQVTTSDTLPTGVAADTDHYVQVANTTHYALSLTVGGSNINFTDAGQGTHTVTEDLYRNEDERDRIWKDIELPGTTSPSRAQRICSILLEQQRRQITASLPLKLSAFKVQAADNFNLTNTRMGWSAKSFEALSWSFGTEEQDGVAMFAIDIDAQETDANVYAWSVDSEESFPAAPTTNLPDPFTVEAVSGLSVSSNSSTVNFKQDGTPIVRLHAQWTAATDAFISSGGRVETEFKASADSTWISHLVLPGNFAETYIQDVEEGSNYDVRVRFVNNYGIKGAYSTVSNHTAAGDTVAPATPTVTHAYTAGGKQLTLTEPSEIDWAYWVIWRSTDTGASYTRWRQVARPQLDWVDKDSAGINSTLELNKILYKVSVGDTSNNESSNTTSKGSIAWVAHHPREFTSFPADLKLLPKDVVQQAYFHTTPSTSNVL